MNSSSIFRTFYLHEIVLDAKLLFIRHNTVPSIHEILQLLDQISIEVCEVWLYLKMCSWTESEFSFIQSSQKVCYLYDLNVLYKLQEHLVSCMMAIFVMLKMMLKVQFQFLLRLWKVCVVYVHYMAYRYNIQFYICTISLWSYGHLWGTSDVGVWPLSQQINLPVNF